MSVEVAQADRESAVDFIYDAQLRKMVLDGQQDGNPHVQAFARHRIEALERAALERAAVVDGD